MKKVDDPETLLRIVRNEGSGDVRCAAVEKVTDPETLKYAALHDDTDDVRFAAVKNIDDQDLLIRMALTDVSGKVRRAAAEKITDPGTLKLIALNDDDIGVRCAAVSNPGADQETLIHIAMHDDCAAVRLKAVRWIDDMKVLKHVAWYDGDSRVMEAAAERIYDAGNSYICHFISFVIDYMRSYRINIDSMSIRSCVPKDRLLSYLNGGKPNYADFHEIARAMDIDYKSFVEECGP